MTAIFEDETTAQSTAASPTTGSGTIKVQYECAPAAGGVMTMWTRVAAEGSYIIALRLDSPDVRTVDVDGLQYFFRWTPRVSGATASVYTT